MFGPELKKEERSILLAALHALLPWRVVRITVQHWARLYQYYRHILCLITVLAVTSIPSNDRGCLDLLTVVSIMARVSKGIFQHWIRFYWHIRKCLCLITGAATLPSSHHGDMDVAPVVSMALSLMSVPDHEEVLELRSSRLVIVTPVKFIRLVSYVSCHLQLHEKYLSSDIRYVL